MNRLDRLLALPLDEFITTDLARRSNKQQERKRFRFFMVNPKITFSSFVGVENRVQDPYPRRSNIRAALV